MPLITIKKTEQNIHLAIWEITESHDALWSMLSSEMLTDAELAEVHHPLKQIEFFASRLCIKSLANSLNINYLGIKKDSYGKPFLVGTSWQMSLTHTSNFVAVVMHPTKSLGIDMEKPSEKIRRISHKFLSKNELLAAENDLEKLCIYWSSKEVLYKIYGKRKVIFSKNLIIYPFQKKATFIHGEIQMPDYQAIVKLEVIKWQSYILVIGA